MSFSKCLIVLFLGFSSLQAVAHGPPDCEQRHLTKVVERARSNALGYGFLIGGMIANAAASAGITVWVNPNAEFFSTMTAYTLGQATFVAASLLSPFSEPLAARIRRFAFASKTNAESAVSDLEGKADTIHATFTLREQYATDRIFLFRNALRLNFQTAALAALDGDRDSVVAEIADAALSGYDYFKDLDPNEPAIKNTIYASFLVKVQNPMSFKDEILALIHKRHPVRDKKADAYYERALDAWLTHAD